MKLKLFNIPTQEELGITQADWNEYHITVKDHITGSLTSHKGDSDSIIVRTVVDRYLQWKDNHQ